MRKLCYLFNDHSTTGTGLDRIIEMVEDDNGLNVNGSELNEATTSMNRMNEIILEAIDKTGAGEDGHISTDDLKDMNGYIREYYQSEWDTLHGDDEGTATAACCGRPATSAGDESGLHNIVGDGGNSTMFGQNFINTVADGIYHMGYEIKGNNFLNEDGNKNASLDDVSGWINFFFSDQSTSGTGLDCLVDMMKKDAGLLKNTSADDIVTALDAADEMNIIIDEAITKQGLAKDGHISVDDIYEINSYIRENYSDRWEELHGDDVGGGSGCCGRPSSSSSESGFHLIVNDGGTEQFYENNLINTVADGLYHLGSEIVDGRVLNEDGNANATVADLAQWLNQFYIEKTPYTEEEAKEIEQEKIADAKTEITQSQENLENAKNSLATAKASLEVAKESESSADQAYSDILDENAQSNTPDQEKENEAFDELMSAKRAVNSAEKKVTSAETAIEKAEERVNDANETLDNLKAEADNTNVKVALIKKEIQEDKEDLDKAQQEEDKAQDILNKAQNDVKDAQEAKAIAITEYRNAEDGSQEQDDALKDIEKANKTLEKAEKAETLAEENEALTKQTLENAQKELADDIDTLNEIRGTAPAPELVETINNTTTNTTSTTDSVDNDLVNTDSNKPTVSIMQEKDGDGNTYTVHITQAVDHDVTVLVGLGRGHDFSSYVKEVVIKAGATESSFSINRAEAAYSFDQVDATIIDVADSVGAWSGDGVSVAYKQTDEVNGMDPTGGRYSSKVYEYTATLDAPATHDQVVQVSTNASTQYVMIPKGETQAVFYDTWGGNVGSGHTRTVNSSKTVQIDTAHDSVVANVEYSNPVHLEPDSVWNFHVVLDEVKDVDTQVVVNIGNVLYIDPSEIGSHTITIPAGEKSVLYNIEHSAANWSGGHRNLNISIEDISFEGESESISLVSTPDNHIKGFSDSPIILDLDGDGVETVGLEHATNFDLDADGKLDKTGWVDKDDGLLVRDINHDGKIDDGNELFGNHAKLADGTEAANGFEALAELDTNHDGKIDAKDDAFDELEVWKDSDGDGVTDEGELISLEEAGVQSIDVGFTESDKVENGNEFRQVGSFTGTDGEVHEATDVWFEYESGAGKETVLDFDKLNNDSDSPTLEASGVLIKTIDLNDHTDEIDMGMLDTIPQINTQENTTLHTKENVNQEIEHSSDSIINLDHVIEVDQY